MATVRFTYALKRFFPDIKDMPAKGNSLKEILNEIESRYPRIQNYLVDDQGKLREHVNIFIDGNLITDRAGLSDTFSQESEIYIMQALSGG
ncbi:MAG TPA: MoaD/ThiS family protein [Puia sp.]|nr:MoaD/ThiS family protein [Puia sp.]